MSFQESQNKPSERTVSKPIGPTGDDDTYPDVDFYTAIQLLSSDEEEPLPTLTSLR